MEIYNVALWSLWGSFLIVMPLVAWMFKTKNSTWGSFWSIWLATATMTGLILVGFLLFPDQISNLVEKLSNTLK